MRASPWLVVEEAFSDGRAVLVKPRIVVEAPIRGECAAPCRLTR